MSRILNSYTSFNKMLRSPLLPLFSPDSDGNIPVAHLDYSGPASQYCIFNSGTTQPEVFGSGLNRVIRGYCYVDYFSKSDDSGTGGKTSQIEAALNAAPGLTVTRVSEIGKDESGWYHTEFSVTASAEVPYV